MVTIIILTVAVGIRLIKYVLDFETQTRLEIDTRIGLDKYTN
jgi:hypothetical protein